MSSLPLPTAAAAGISQDRAPVRGCDGCATEPPEPVIDNRPGLPALSYRLGTWSTFLARMLTQAPVQAVDDGGGTVLPLATLNQRAVDDASIAIFDAYAVVADVLTFYQERIANEGFLRTATERRSILELARAIGYELRPGVAASTWLGFTVDTPVAPPKPATAQSTPAEPQRAMIPAGSQVQSMPAAGQLPQTFETIEDLLARVEWNTLLPRQTQPQRFVIEGGRLRLRNTSGTATTEATHVYLAKTTAGVRVGDTLLAVDATGAALPLAVLDVALDTKLDQTVVRIAAANTLLRRLPSLPAPVTPPPQTTGVIELAPLQLEAKVVEKKILHKVWDEASLAAFCAVQRWDPTELVAVVAQILSARAASSQIHAFSQRLACFGANAPAYKTVHLQPTPSAPAIQTVLDTYGYTSSPYAYASYEPDTMLAKVIAQAMTAQPDPDPDDWDQNPRSIAQGSSGETWASTSAYDVFLERVVTQLIPGGWVVFKDATRAAPFLITKVGETTLTSFATTARATGLRLDLAPGWGGEQALFGFDVRRTTASVQSASLPLVELPVPNLIERRPADAAPSGAVALELDRMVVGLAVGQTVLLTGATVGADDGPTGLVRSEAVTLAAIVHREGYTTVYFESALAYRYLRASVTLTANVALATHGQTVPREILGSGDSSMAGQSFVLQKPPLTWVPAPTASGNASTLTLRVDGTAWTRVSTLYGQAPGARCYVLREGNDGRTTVIFGDGICGARLPTGTGNVVATYRSGIGLGGQVGAGTLTMLMSRPAGLRAVNNPLAADGAADPEARDDARTNAPVTVLTLERIVSLRDYENFARAFAGVGKASAVALWDGAAQRIHLTVAAADQTPLDTSSALYDALTGAIDASSDGLERVQVDGFAQRYFRLEATLILDPLADPSTVGPAVAAILESTFSFAARKFGQPVRNAEVMAVIQAVSGVVATNLTALVALTDTGSDVGSGVASFLPAATARWASGSVSLAELLLLHPAGMKLTVATADGSAPSGGGTT